MNENNDKNTDDLLTNFDDDADIFRLIRTMQKEHSSLSVEFQSLDKPYASIIIACDPKKRTFTIDNLHPADGNHLLRQGRKFSIIGLCNGVPAVLNNSRITSDSGTTSEHDGNFSGGFRLKFPNTITYQQRRQFFRTQVPRILDARTSFSDSKQEESEENKQKEIISGRLIDLSNTGFACEFSIDEKSKLKKHSLIKNFIIHIPEWLEISCSIRIMNARKVNKNPIVRCGMAFTDLSAQQERVVSKCVLRIQQKLRQTETVKPN